MMKIKNNKAVYQEHIDINLNSNPLTEAISVEMNKKALLEKLTRLPPIQDGFWELPEVYQLTQLRTLTDIHIPLPQCWNIYNKIISLILFGYINRNPFSREQRILTQSVAGAVRDGRYYRNDGNGHTTAPSVLARGESGSGKTKTILSILEQIPQVIQHTAYKQRHFKKLQLVWVSFELPPNGSPKAMAANFFRAVDSALGTDYAVQWSDNYRNSVDKMMAAMQLVSANHCLGLVHIDELQFMLGYKKIKGSPSLQTLESLFNKIGVPILQSSTQQGVALFETYSYDTHQLGHDITTVRRMLNDREFKFSTHTISSKYFNDLYQALFPESLNYGTIGLADKDKFKASFHQLSCGLPAIMVRLAHLYHETFFTLSKKQEFQENGYISPSVDILNRVYQNQFSLIDPALQALRAGNNIVYEEKIRKDTKKVSYTNKEIKKQKQSTPATSVPAVLKDKSSLVIQPSVAEAIDIHNFNLGIEK